MIMTFVDTLRDGFNTAVGTISAVAHALLEKNRTNAKLNRLRAVMKSESELMNRAYIALGKGYYEQLKKGEKPASEREQKLVELIDACKSRIAKARRCYRETVESQNAFIFTPCAVSAPEKDEEKFEKEEVVDITVACSNENEYDSSPFEKAESSGEKDIVEEIADELIDDESPIDELF